MQTRDFKETVNERVRRDPAFAKALLDEAATAFLNGEADTARPILRDLVEVGVRGHPPVSAIQLLAKRGSQR